MKILHYEIATIEQTCDACPSQWDATATDGTHLYIRYRWGVLRVDKVTYGYPDVHETLLEIDGRIDSDGVMTTEQMLEHTAILPFKYRVGQRPYHVLIASVTRCRRVPYPVLYALAFRSMR